VSPSYGKSLGVAGNISTVGAPNRDHSLVVSVSALPLFRRQLLRLRCLLVVVLLVLASLWRVTLFPCACVRERALLRSGCELMMRALLAVCLRRCTGRLYSYSFIDVVDLAQFTK
jgi:hypothetical protein